MTFIKKNKFLISFSALAALPFIISLITLYFLGFSYLPLRGFKEKEALCLNHLENASYQLKQLILENINNSRLWVYSQENSFFDSKWVGIALYEHNGSEWVLKNFQVNSVVLDLYGIPASEFVKREQNLMSPHPDAEQISVQQNQLQDQKILVIESTNNLKIETPHMLRVSILNDQVRSILDSNPTCPLSLFEPKGDFLLEKESGLLQKNYIESKASEKMIAQEVYGLELNNSLSYSKKILKNVTVVNFLESNNNYYAQAFAQILFFNFCGCLIAGYLAFQILNKKWKSRISSIKETILQFAHSDYQRRFDTDLQDEFSEIDESLSELKDLAKRRSKLKD